MFVKACSVVSLTLLLCLGMVGCLWVQEKFRSEGTLVVVKGQGRTPSCLLKTDDGTFYKVSGVKARELLSLPGAHVLLEGRLNPSSPYQELVVSRYTILDISGNRPIVGVLIREGRDFKLKSHSSGVWRLDFGGFQEGLPRAGDRLWVLGRVQGDTLVVDRFGILGE